MSNLKHLSRVRRFAINVWVTRGAIFTAPVSWPNVRACWTQSDPDWLTNLPPLDLTDAEWSDYLKHVCED